MPDDEELIRAVGSGKRDAFDVLGARYYPDCLRFAQRYLGDRDDAEDVVQEAMVRAFRALRRGTRPRRVRPWLLRIVLNRARTVLAQRSRRRRLLDGWLSRRRAVGYPTKPLATDDIDPRVRAALDSLKPPLREAFLLKHVEELTYDEMAEVTGAGVSALKMRVKRASVRLVEMLTEDI
jgi:RNA polymerase sigma-70 factor (ECF subfamily)